MGSCGIAGASVVVLAASAAKILLECRRLEEYKKMIKIFYSESYLVYGHAASIVLVIVLGIDQLSGQCILAAYSGIGRSWRGRIIMAIKVQSLLPTPRSGVLGWWGCHVECGSVDVKLQNKKNKI